MLVQVVDRRLHVDTDLGEVEPRGTFGVDEADDELGSPVGGSSSGNAADVEVPAGSVDATSVSASDVGPASVDAGSDPSVSSAVGTVVSEVAVSSATVSVLAAVASSAGAASSSLLQATAASDTATTIDHRAALRKPRTCPARCWCVHVSPNARDVGAADIIRLQPRCISPRERPDRFDRNRTTTRVYRR